MININKLSIFNFIIIIAEKCAADNFNDLIFSSEKETEEKIPNYRLRADTEFSLNNTTTTSTNNCDWVRAPSYFDEQQISELTNEQIQFTLDYFSKINIYILLHSLIFLL